MTEQDKEYQRVLKDASVARLKKAMSGKKGKEAQEKLDRCDRRIWLHLSNVRKKPLLHCLREIQACARLAEKARRYIVADKEVRRVIKVLENLPHSGSDGKVQFVASPVECCMLCDAYGFYKEVRLEDGSKELRRVTRTVYWVVPRKFGKTELTASMAVNELFFGEFNAECYIASNSYQQAKICFDRIRKIMFALDPDGETFRINRERIFFENGARDSMCRCLACNPDTLDGLFASLVIIDEYAQAHATPSGDGSEMKAVLTSSMGPRKNPLTIIITTASKYVNGPCANELHGVRHVLDGEIENDAISAWIYEPDVDDEESDPATWRKVHPHMGMTVSSEFYAEEYKKASLSAGDMNAFRTKLLNIFDFDATKCWIDPKWYEPVTIDWNPTQNDYRKLGPAYITIDLSESGDLTAVTACLLNKQERQCWLYTSYFFARGAMEGHHNRKLYEEWSRRGWLTLTDGPVIDYKAVVDYVMVLARNLHIMGIGYDQWKSKDVVNRLKAIGGPEFLIPVGQTYGHFTSACQFYEHGVKTQTIFLDPNPINAYCAANAILDIDKMNNCKPLKRDPEQKIDGLITQLMAIKMMMEANNA